MMIPTRLCYRGNIERLQEAQVARHLMSLPSFSEAPVRRFNDHREYVDHRQPGPPAGYDDRSRDRPRESGLERWKDGWKWAEMPKRWIIPSKYFLEFLPLKARKWCICMYLLDDLLCMCEVLNIIITCSTGSPLKMLRSRQEDAFFGWLPGRGDDDPTEMTRLRRPLQQARLARLPSFAEGSKELAGVTGRGIGILTLWINGAARLAYSVGSGLHGKPSPAVKVKLRGDRGGQQKITATIPRENNPKWNSPPMTFEVNSRRDVLQLEVLDWANPRGEEHLNQHFLGRAQKHLDQIIEALHRSKNPTKPWLD